MVPSKGGSDAYENVRMQETGKTLDPRIIRDRKLLQRIFQQIVNIETDLNIGRFLGCMKGKKWGDRPDSNRRPLVPQTSALTN